MHAHVAAVLRGIVAVLHLHFLNRIDAGNDVGDGDEVVHDGDAVERKAVGDFTLAGADEILTRWNADLAGLRPLNDIGSGRGEFESVAAV